MKNNIQYEKKDLYPSSKQCGSYLTEVGKRVPLFEDNENSKLCSAKAFQQRNPARTISYSDISQTDISGFPICIARDESGELQATFCEDTHGLIIGSTGSGKTTGFVLPFLNWMPSKKNKPSIVVSDPKNELNEQTVNRFIKEGYRVIWLNFQDYTVSDCWNPLTKIYRMYQKYLNVEDEVTVVSENGKKYNKFRGVIYKKQSDLDLAILTVRDGILSEVTNMIGIIANSVSPIEKATDPYWDTISATYIRGFLWAMLEDSAPGTQNPITEDTFSFDTMLRIYETFSDGPHGFKDNGYFGNRNPETSKAYQLVYKNIISISANNTRNCITSTFSEKIKKFQDTSIRRITSANTMDMDTLDNGAPVAIFVSYKDEDSLHYDVIGMFLTDLYKSLIAISRRKNGSLNRPFYFLIDEFGNFPKFVDFEKVISACRSRKIFFLLIVQSIAQLEKVYEKNTAAIIMDNLNMHIFFGSCNYETKKAFSEECGMHTVISPISALNGSTRSIDHFEKELVPLIPISRLSELSDGECIITQMRGGVLRSKIERSYLCQEYLNGISKILHRPSPVPFLDRRYAYDVTHLVQSKSKASIDLFDF